MADTSPRRGTATTPSCTAASTARPAGTFATGTTASPRARRPSAPLAEIVKRKQDGDYRSPDRITLADYLNDRWLPLKKSQLSRSTFELVPEQRPAARRTEDRIDPASTAPARGPRHVVRRAARRREAQRCRRRARTEVGPEHPRHAPQGARRRPSQGHRAPQRGRPRRPAEGAHAERRTIRSGRPTSYAASSRTSRTPCGSLRSI